jgi:hypothetical protein
MLWIMYGVDYGSGRRLVWVFLQLIDKRDQFIESMTPLIYCLYSGPHMVSWTWGGPLLSPGATIKSLFLNFRYQSALISYSWTFVFGYERVLRRNSFNSIVHEKFNLHLKYLRYFKIKETLLEASRGIDLEINAEDKVCDYISSSVIRTEPEYKDS